MLRQSQHPYVHILLLLSLPSKAWVDERIHGLCHTDYSGEHDAPRVGTVESACGSDGNSAEQDGSREGHESDVSAGDVLLECLHERGHDQRHEPRCESGRGGNIHMVLLG